MEQDKTKYLGIREFLKRKNLTQREAAELLGCTVGNVGSISTGTTRPGFDLQLKLIDNGISSAELFGEETAEKLRKNDAEYFGSKELPADIDAIIEAKIKKIMGGK